ncbi:hypothetical protein D3C78_1607840 [compost metagenome]
MRAFLDPVAELADAITAEAIAGNVAHLDPGSIDVLPHVGGDAATHCVGIGPGRLQTAIDTAGVGRVEGEEVQHALGIEFGVPAAVVVQRAGCQQ